MKLKGRILYLTDDVAPLAAQVAGQDPGWSAAEVPALHYGVNTDAMMPKPE